MSTSEQPVTGDELRLLRARAYGPDADILDDPEAMRRLRELEEQARPAGEASDPAASGAVASSSAAAGSAAAGSAAAGSAAAGSAAADPGAEDPRAIAPVTSAGAAADLAANARRGPEDAVHSGVAEARGTRSDDADTDASRTQEGVPPADAAQGPAPTPVPAGGPWWRRTRTLWIASVVLAAVVASAVTLAASTLSTGRVAVLAVDPDAEPPDGFFDQAGEGVVFEEFFGLTAVLAQQVWTRGEVLDCVFVRSAAGDAQMATGGCAGGGFPPTAAMVVTPSFPRELRERFPDGTALQFVVEGSEVHVYAKEPVVDPTP